MDPLELLQAWENMHGLVQTLGMRFTATEGGIRTAMRVTPEMMGGPAVAHGGVLLSLLDTGMGAAVLLHALQDGRVASTLELKSNFLRPTPVGTEIYCDAELLHIGRSHVVAKGEVFAADTGEVLAIATGTFNLYSPRANEAVSPP